MIVRVTQPRKYFDNPYKTFLEAGDYEVVRPLPNDRFLIIVGFETLTVVSKDEIEVLA